MSPEYMLTGPDGRDTWVFVQDLDGLAVRAGDTPTIYVKETLSDKARLQTLLHEGCHMCFPDATETQVRKAERFLAELVTKCWLKPLKGKHGRSVC